MAHRYLITDDFVVEFRADDQSDSDAPWLRQPYYPNGVYFQSREDAEAWSDKYLLYLEGVIPDLPISKEDVETE